MCSTFLSVSSLGADHCTLTGGRLTAFESLAESRILGLEVGQLTAQRREMWFEFGGAEARSDVLLAVPVEGLDGDEHGPLHFGVVTGVGDALDEGRVVGDGDDAGMAEYLQPAALRLVQDDHRHSAAAGDRSGG